MAEVINLRAARKHKKRQDDERRAAENRAAHGRTKVDRQRQEALTAKAERNLDAHRIDREDGR